MCIEICMTWLEGFDLVLENIVAWFFVLLLWSYQKFYEKFKQMYESADRWPWVWLLYRKPFSVLLTLENSWKLWWNRTDLVNYASLLEESLAVMGVVLFCFCLFCFKIGQRNFKASIYLNLEAHKRRIGLCPVTWLWTRHTAHKPIQAFFQKSCW